MIYEKNYSVCEPLTDDLGTLKPSSILLFVQDIAEQHCKKKGCDWASMAEKGLFWAVIRHRMEITRLPRLGETVRMQTWPMPTTRTCYPRSVAAFDQNGTLLFQVHSLWVLMDRQTRAMVLPGKSGITVDGTLQGTELPTPQSLVPKALEKKATREVTPADLDRNGHMNNVRYLDWVFDLLPEAFRRENTPRHISLCYVSEAREGEVLTLNWTQAQDNTLRVEVTEEEKNKRIFGALLGWE